MTRSERNEIVEKYYWFAVKHANKYHNIVHDKDERRSMAGESLVRAIDTYDPSKGARLTTHIMNCIRGDMLKERQKNNRMCRDAIVLSLDARIPIDGGETVTMYDILPSDSVNPIEFVVNRDLCREVRDAFRTLTLGQKMIIRERYIQDNSLTQEQVGEKYGRTRQWVSSLETRGLRNIKKYIENLHSSTPTFGARRVIL